MENLNETSSRNLFFEKCLELAEEKKSIYQPKTLPNFAIYFVVTTIFLLLYLPVWLTMKRVTKTKHSQANLLSRN